MNKGSKMLSGTTCNKCSMFTQTMRLELSSLKSAAFDAVEANDPDQLREVFQHLSLVRPQLDKETLGNLLLRACETNADDDVAELLIQQGADVNHRNKDQSTNCLMMAAKEDNSSVLSCLIAKGAKVNEADKYSWTALFYAAYFGSLNCARLLLERGALVNLLDSDKMSSLIWAAGREHQQMVELLLEFGANVNAQDRYNTSALIWASRKGNTRIVSRLVESGAKVNQQGMYGWTPLFVAVKGNHLETTKYLLGCKPSVNTWSGKMTPLLVACAENLTEVGLELIKHGTSVHQTDADGNTALIFAAKSRNPTLVKALLEAGSLAEHRALNQRNAIHWSVILDDAESCRLFFELDIDLTATTATGETYLMLAAKHGSSEVIKMLIELDFPYKAAHFQEEQQIEPKFGETSRNEQLIELLSTRADNYGMSSCVSTSTRARSNSYLNDWMTANQAWLCNKT